MKLDIQSSNIILSYCIPEAGVTKGTFDVFIYIPEAGIMKTICYFSPISKLIPCVDCRDT
jgi:hypothetical protein